ncbi:MAG: rhamnose transport system substrate-binding protein, partial [Mycobacterium sp.]|nr:rhamnose transport system substrate-binding protein [Mycobacterium sp.]
MKISQRVVGGLCVALAVTMIAGGCTKKNENGTSTGGSASSGGKVKVAFVPKLQGSPYFEAMDAGAKQAATALGDIEWLYQGPTSADAAAQAQVVRSF